METKTEEKKIQLPTETSYKKLPLDSKGKLIPNDYGLRSPRNLVMVSFPKMGKALRNSTKIITEKGNISIENLKIGDRVYGSNGELCNVTGVFPQGRKNIYSVVFRDGTIIQCCEDHLWTIWSRRYRKYKTIPLKEMYENDDIYSIPCPLAIDYPKQDLLIEPYLLGLFIGDGSLTGAANLCFSEEKVELLKYINYEYTIKKQKKEFRVNVKGVYSKIKELKLDTKSQFKEIPEQYMTSSIEDRLSILQGLCDTDGYATDRGGVEFSTTSKTLATQVQTLVKSLGGKCQISSRMGKYTKGDGVYITALENYRVNFNLIDFCPFRLSYKKEKYIPYSKGEYKLAISEIIKEEIEDDCTCISVDSQDKLFLCDSYILTHNTLAMTNVKNILIGDCEEGTQYFKASNSANMLSFEGSEEFTKVKAGYIPSGIFQVVDELNKANKMKEYLQLFRKLEDSRIPEEKAEIYQELIAHLQAMPFPIFVIDTITSVQHLNNAAALYEYNLTAGAKNPKSDIKRVDEYGGVRWIRNQFNIIKSFIENNASPFIIWSGHIGQKKKILKKAEDEISAVDIALEGLLSNIFTAQADANCIFYRNEEGCYLDFRKKEESDLGSRPFHLSNKVVKIADIMKEGEEGNPKTYWEKIYPELNF